jgi:DNA helicase-2/ATP-dependent DNA helicase PcrA
MDTSALERELNPPQYQAVLHTEGPLLVFAGAGSGKTRVITYRIAHILQSRAVAPWKVLAVTFTNKAAGEMRERIGRLVGPERARELWVATFHATGAKLLRRYAEKVGLRKDFAIYDDGDQRAVMNRVYDELHLDDKSLPKSAVLAAIDRAKQEVTTAAMMHSAAKTPQDILIAKAYQSYERRLGANNAVDFGDLLAKVALMLETDEAVRTELQERFHYLLVDEFQDTNNAQYRILRSLVGARRNLCVVGDDDQAIYRWRGADVRNIQFFKRDFPEAQVIKLEQNYRSTKKVLRAANAVISKSKTREAKTLFTQNAEGPPIAVMHVEDERAEGASIARRVKGAIDQGVSRKEIAVFYRIHAQSRPIEEAMRAANVPYTIIGGMRFYERAEVKDILAYLRLMLNPNDDTSLLRVVNTPSRKIGKTTTDRLAAYATARQTTIWKLIASGDYPDDVGGAARKALTGFYTLVGDLRKKANAMLERPSEIAQEVFTRTGYKTMLDDPTDHDNESRRENVAELIGSMKDYEAHEREPSLQEYLERVSLSEETASAEGGEKVSLMSVHAAKGLEFQVVFLAGMEDGMFPYKGVNAGDDPDEMEEERRLAYVAITRARQQLVVSYARFRQIFGETKIRPPSRFLTEIPVDVLSEPVTRSGSGDTAPRRPGMIPTYVHRPSKPAASHDHNAHDGPVLVRGAYADAIPEDDDIAVSTGAGTSNYRRGTRVKHAKWGPGTVKGVIAGAELKLEVYFPAIGQTKTLLAEYVRPLY